MENNKKSDGKRYIWGVIKTILYIAVVVIILLIVSYLFGWTNLADVPTILQPIGWFLVLVNPYLIWIQITIVIILGYLIVNTIGNMIFRYIKKYSGRSTASSIRTIIRIVGFGILLAIVASILQVDPAAALTLGSFTGLIIGFATQNVIGNIISGIVLVITRPFKPGEVVTISGRTGTIKEITLMRVILTLPKGENEILIPSSTVLNSLIVRKNGLRKIKRIKNNNFFFETITIK
ncbi:MAG: mechanosensitive ion channel [Candidatus Lokiarchaeota archaeon]|nr:mechanosensitive ion channel [Candidatus Lokiarchaeota archaeon]